MGDMKKHALERVLSSILERQKRSETVLSCMKFTR